MVVALLWAMVTLPPLSTVKSEPVVEPMAKAPAVPRLVVSIESFAQGDVVPMPTKPLRVAKYAEPLEVNEVVEASGKTFAVVAVEVMAPVMESVEVAVIAPPKNEVPEW